MSILSLGKKSSYLTTILAPTYISRRGRRCNRPPTRSGASSKQISMDGLFCWLVELKSSIAMNSSPPQFGNGWTDCAEIWYVVRKPLARHLTEVDDGVQLHLRTCAPLFRVSGTAEIWSLIFGRESRALKFGVWLWAQRQCVLHVLRV